MDFIYYIFKFQDFNLLFLKLQSLNCNFSIKIINKFMHYILDVTLFKLIVMSICKIFVVKFDSRLVFS